MKMILEEFCLVFQQGSDCFELKDENRPIDGENSGMGRIREGKKEKQKGGEEEVRWKGKEGGENIPRQRKPSSFHKVFNLEEFEKERKKAVPSVRENQGSMKTHLSLVLDEWFSGRKRTKWTRGDHLEDLLILAGSIGE